jgi:ferric-dicitrate binding protein FerR (iron transport regulator)
MPTIARCPACGQELQLPDSLRGKRVRCGKCQEVFTADPTPEEPLSAVARERRNYDRDYDEDDEEQEQEQYERPRRRRRRQPHRGSTILVLGILGLVLCVPLGIAAWVMGTSDLAAMSRGEMDRSGEGMTRAGQILGIIATVLAILWFCVFGMLLLAGGLR